MTSLAAELLHAQYPQCWFCIQVKCIHLLHSVLLPSNSKRPSNVLEMVPHTNVPPIQLQNFGTSSTRVASAGR